MDPDACLAEAEAALRDGDLDTCRERLEDFAEWCSMRGFVDGTLLNWREDIAQKIEAA